MRDFNYDLVSLIRKNFNTKMGDVKVVLFDEANNPLGWLLLADMIQLLLNPPNDEFLCNGMEKGQVWVWFKHVVSLKMEER